MGTKKVQRINNDNIELLNNDGYNILYGAGRTGDVVIAKLLDNGIKIDFVLDDDPNKWNTTNKYGYVIRTMEELKSVIGGVEASVNIIITSIYGNLLMNKISELYEVTSDINIFEVIDLRAEDFTIINKVQSEYNEEKEEWNKEFEKAVATVEDEKSKKVLEGIKICLETGDRSILHEICTDEEFYFIDEVVNALEPEFNIIDGGAYIGDLYRQLKELRVPFNKWYCFECDKDSYRAILDNFKDSLVKDKMIVENSGLSDVNKKSFIEMDGVCSKLVDYKTLESVSVVSIDSYFETGDKIDYIKMDIEGEELNALKGGIKTIKRCRPIMAISIYHKLFDYVSIILYLKEMLTEYKFLVRHHAWVLGKTILYCIPKEKMKE